MNAIPVIDASRLDAVEMLCAIDEACRKWGFCQVVHHGVGPRPCAALLREARAFFALPLSAKRRVARSADNPWGFYDPNSQRTRRIGSRSSIGARTTIATRPRGPTSVPG
jgi:isopenicillin N synthase-like dioxygenase